MRNRLLHYVRNFYVATGLGLLVWLLFFDANDLRSQFQNGWTLRQLEQERAFYKEQIRQVRDQQQQVLGSRALREKYAREKYLMKRRNEDVFVIVDENNEPIEP